MFYRSDGEILQLLRIRRTMNKFRGTTKSIQIASAHVLQNLHDELSSKKKKKKKCFENVFINYVMLGVGRSQEFVDIEDFVTLVRPNKKVYITIGVKF